MSTSFYQAIPFILSQLEMEQPSSILDLGIGHGKYGVLAREILELQHNRYAKDEWKTRIDGIEVVQQYVNPVYKYAYDNVYFGEFEEVINCLDRYDIVLFINVLQYFSKEKGLEVIKKVLEHTNKFLLISIPLYPVKQYDYKRNTFEDPKSIWSIIDFREFDFTYYRVNIGSNEAQMIKIFPKIKNATNHIDKVLLQNLDKAEPCRLNITYVLPHKKLTGGLKMLLMQMEQMKLKGHKVNAILKSDTEQSAIPEFYPIQIDRDVVIPNSKDYKDYIADEDIIVASYFTQLEELELSKKPVLYWEQGFEYLFGDFQDPIHEKSIKNLLTRSFETQTYIVSVSNYVQEVLLHKYSRYTRVMPNYIDTEVFKPLEKSKVDKEFIILLVGPPTLKFKGFDVAIKVLETVWKQGYTFKVKWVTQQKFIPLNVQFPIEYEYSPNHDKLVSIYQEADVLLWTSWYEGFGMPPLEAMATGVPIVSTDCGGVETFAKHFENAILAEPGDIKALAAGLIFLMKKEELRKQMGCNARETALHYSYEKGMHNFESILYTVVNQKRL